MKNLSNIKNLISKSFLMIVGALIMLSLFWRYILQGFNLNTSDVVEWTRTDTILLIVSFLFIAGAAQFNRLVDLGINILSKFSK